MRALSDALLHGVRLNRGDVPVAPVIGSRRSVGLSSVAPVALSVAPVALSRRSVGFDSFYIRLYELAMIVYRLFKFSIDCI